MSFTCFLTRIMTVMYTLADSAGSVYIYASFRLAVVCVRCHFILHPAESTYYVM